MSLRPTSASVRGVVAGAAILLTAVVLQRPDIVLLATPLVLYACLACTQRVSDRPVTVEATGAPVRYVEVGDSIDVGFQRVGDTSTCLAAIWDVSEYIVSDSVASFTTHGRVRTVVVPQRWGRYVVAPARTYVTDVWGAFRGQVDDVPATILLVVPRTVSFVGVDGVARPTGANGVHVSARKGDGPGLADLREFRPGDRVRRIHWHATARHGSPYVVEGEREVDTDILICVDTTSDLPGGPGQPSSLDRSMDALAGIARYYATRRDRVIVWDIGEVLGSSPPATGGHQVQRVLDLIAHADRSRWTPRVHAHASSRLRPGTLVFFLSPFVSPGAVSELLRLRAAGCDCLAVDVIGSVPAEWRRPFLDADDYSVEAAALVKLERADLEPGLRDLGIPLIPWTDESSLADVLRSLAGARPVDARTVGLR